MAKPHVVVFPLPTRGHVNPMMHFSKILASHGCVITFVNSEFNANLLHTQPQWQPEVHKAGRLDIRLVAIPDGLPPEHGRTTDPVELCKAALSNMGEPFEKLVESLLRKDPPVTCILADTWMVFALDVAKKFGLLHANFWTQSAASFASMLLVIKGYRPLTDPQIPGALFLKPCDMNSFVQSYDPSDFMFQFVTGGFDRLSESDWIFINTFDELEYDTIQALRNEHRISTVGPLLPASFLSVSPDKSNRDMATLWEEDDRCLEWLDRYPSSSVLYVSFGSLALLSAKQIDEIALGLEASEYPFLWVVRADLMYGKSAVFPEGFAERVKHRAEFVSWAPQLKVLCHKAVGGFFTHGGWNSTLESIAAGVPMLGWPYFSDQAMDCKCIEKGWKIGLCFKEVDDERMILREEIARNVRTLMGNKELSERARRWSSAAKQAALEDLGGSSSMNLKSFVAALNCGVSEFSTIRLLR